MTIRGVLFDKDGTLIDVNGTWVPIYRRMLCEQFAIDVEAAEKLMQRVGYNPVTDGFVANSILASGTTRQLVENWWPDLEEAGIQEKLKMIDVDYAPLSKSLLKPLMPLAPLLKQFKAMKLSLGIATNDSHYSALNHMTHLGVADLFDEIIGADTVPVPKPSGYMIGRFARSMKLDAAEIAMVGDNSHDMEEARNGGAGLAIAVLTGNAAHDEIAHLADYTIASIAELPALLESL